MLSILELQVNLTNEKGGIILNLILACHHYLSLYRWLFYNIYEMKLAIIKKKKTPTVLINWL
jgi:hypothetical protein